MQHFSLAACLAVLSGILAAIIILLDLRHRTQPMRIMNAVWPLTGLWAGLVGLAAYFAFGRAARNAVRTAPVKPAAPHPSPETENRPVQADPGRTHDPHDPHDPAEAPLPMPSMQGMRMQMQMQTGAEMPGMASRPRWQSVVLSTLHCGAGCTLADLVGEWLLFFVPVAIAGSLLAGAWVTDYLLALVFGIGFQYAAIRGMERVPRGEAVIRAAKADFLSLTAWQVGMYSWMAIAIFALGDGVPVSRTSWWFWFMMQIGMGCGFLLSLPVNVWLIRKGIKKGM